MLYLAELLFPDVKETIEDLEKRFPQRDLPEGAFVTRIAPSPTGFMHLGNLFGALIDERLAHQSGGVFYLRIEDTDAKREVEGAAEGLIKTLAKYGINFDEGAILDENGNIADKGAYGPYKQSMRGPIYQTYAKQLVREGKAYPCFTTEEELDELQAVNNKIKNYNRWDPIFNCNYFALLGWNAGSDSDIPFLIFPGLTRFFIRMKGGSYNPYDPFSRTDPVIKQNEL